MTRSFHPTSRLSPSLLTGLDGVQSAAFQGLPARIMLCHALFPFLLLLCHRVLGTTAKEDPKHMLVWTTPACDSGWLQRMGNRVSAIIPAKKALCIRKPGDVATYWRRKSTTTGAVEWVTTGLWPAVRDLSCRELFFDEHGNRRDKFSYLAKALAMERMIGKEFNTATIKHYKTFGQRTETITLEDDDILGHSVCPS